MESVIDDLVVESFDADNDVVENVFPVACSAALVFGATGALGGLGADGRFTKILR